jgi:NAD+ synthase (glutamine-hydrolysing)
VYVNLVGGQDELVFDGHSMAVDCDGNIVFQAPGFVDRLDIVEFDPAAGFKVPLPPSEAGTGEDRTQDDNAAAYGALVLAVRDYVTKNGFNGVVLGLSGGVDSALTLAIAVDALGADRVEAVMMPSRYTSNISLEDAARIAKNFGVAYEEISIEPAFESLLSSLQPVFRGLPPDTTEENLQARCRGAILMAISNKKRKLVLATGNKSELAVGYATLYGDMAGGFAPLKDVSKTRVYELCRYRDREAAMIPARVIERAPSAELAPDQKDEDSLPPYPVLDRILELYLEEEKSISSIVADGFDEEIVREVVKKVNRNEYKRRQAAPGVKITTRAFGRERRYPITTGYD